jgi:hypothetical protein
MAGSTKLQRAIFENLLLVWTKRVRRVMRIYLATKMDQERRVGKSLLQDTV